MSKKITKIFILLMLLSPISTELFCQSKKLQKADDRFESGEYFRAVQDYKSILKKVKNKNQKYDYYFKIGECYYNISEYKEARSWYRKLRKSKEYQTKARNRLAEIEIQYGEYDNAINSFNKILEEHPQDSAAKKGLESANLALEWSDKPSRFVVKKAKHLNSNKNDFSPSVDEKAGFDHVYFSSTRKEAKGKKASGITGEKFSDIFVVKYDRKGKWSAPKGLDSINSAYDEGTPCIFNDGRQFYFTSCLVERGKKLGCQIYEATKVDGEFMNAQRLEIVPDSVSIGHPTVSPDGNTLYFSARLQGGFGGADIWYSEKDGSSWGRPKNMGPGVNSERDELFPYMRNDSTLYYSSNKHPTMGGLDLFVAKKKGRNWESSNMEPPFSSSGNDFGIYYYKDEDKGYFSSDRKGSDGEDIYYFEKPPLEFALTGIAKDKDTQSVIDSCDVLLFGSDGSTFRDTTSLKEKKGKFNFKLKSNTDYVFQVSKNGYFNGKQRFTTDSLEYNKVFDYTIELESLNKTMEIPNIEFEFGQWTLTEDSKYVLDSVVRIMIENPYIVVELSAHTDMIGSHEGNMELSQKRANSVTNYFNSRGINMGRLVAKGYGKTKPKVIEKDNLRYAFLPKGSVLSEDFIRSLTSEQQVVANQQNRRIEMRVISNDYIPSLD